jgi:hypothetical protein
MQSSREQMAVERDSPRTRSSSDASMSHTPPRLYQSLPDKSIIRDFAYAKLQNLRAQSAQTMSEPTRITTAAEVRDYDGQPSQLQPGVRKRATALRGAPSGRPDTQEPSTPTAAHLPARDNVPVASRGNNNAPETSPKLRRFTKNALGQVEHVPTNTLGPPPSWHNDRLRRNDTRPQSPKEDRRADQHPPHISDFFENV